jgi:hypothetical protein
MEYGLLFIDGLPLPLLVPKRNLARQMQVEMWLDLAQVIKELGLETMTVIPQTKPEQLSYIR